MIKVVGGCILDSSMTRDSKRRTVDGLQHPCGTLAATTTNSLAGHLPPFRTYTPPAMLDSRLESPAPSRKSPLLDPRISRWDGGHEVSRNGFA